MADKEGRIRNIYFPFDMETDTAMSVAAEMVAELEITDHEVTEIADMINGEIISLVPEWNKSLGLEESPDHTNSSYCQNCASNAPCTNHLSPSNPCAKNLQVLHCSRHGSAAMHGRFEEITYQFEASEQSVTEGAPVVSSQSDGMQYSDDENEQLGKSCLGKEEEVTSMDNANNSIVRKSLSKDPSPARDLAEDYENEIRQELRWLKAKYQMQLRELRDLQLGVISRSTSFSHNANERKEHKKDNLSSISSSYPLEEENNLNLCFPIDAEKNCANQRSKKYDAAYGACSPEHMATANSFYTGDLLPHSLHRATSLPVDAVDF